MKITREEIIRELRKIFSVAKHNVINEEINQDCLLICVEIGKYAAKYGRKTLEDFTDEELEKTLDKVALIVFGFSADDFDDD